MDIVKGYAISIIIVAFISAITEIIMPSDTYKKYIRLAVGAILLIVILTPITRLFQQKLYIDDLSFGSEPYKKNIEQNIDKKVLLIYKQKLSERLMSELLAINLKPNKIEFEIDENKSSKTYKMPLSITIFGIYKSNQAEILIKEKFGLSENKVIYR